MNTDQTIEKTIWAVSQKTGERTQKLVAGQFGHFEAIRFTTDEGESIDLSREAAIFLLNALPAALGAIDAATQVANEFDPFADLNTQGTREAQIGATSSAETATQSTADQCKKPTRHGQPWNADEDALLLAAHADGQSFEHIAAQLGRSAKAIELRLDALQLG